VSLWVNDPDSADDHFTLASNVGIQGTGQPEAWIAFLLNEGKLAEARAALMDYAAQPRPVDGLDRSGIRRNDQAGPKQAALERSRVITQRARWVRRCTWAHCSS
jgi:hypothetical protein